MSYSLCTFAIVCLSMWRRYYVSPRVCCLTCLKTLRGERAQRKGRKHKNMLQTYLHSYAYIHRFDVNSSHENPPIQSIIWLYDSIPYNILSIAFPTNAIPFLQRLVFASQPPANEYSVYMLFYPAICLPDETKAETHITSERVCKYLSTPFPRVFVETCTVHTLLFESKHAHNCYSIRDCTDRMPRLCIARMVCVTFRAVTNGRTCSIKFNAHTQRVLEVTRASGRTCNIDAETTSSTTTTTHVCSDTITICVECTVYYAFIEYMC